jgi:hypothetical protein
MLLIWIKSAPVIPDHAGPVPLRRFQDVDSADISAMRASVLSWPNGSRSLGRIRIRNVLARNTLGGKLQASGGCDPAVAMD